MRKALELADAWGCMWFMENPYTGLLKTRAVVSGIPYRIVDYCSYADPRWTKKYRKATAIWTNTDWQPSKPRCSKKTCPFRDERGNHAERVRFEDSTRDERYAIPPLLCEEIRDHSAVVLAVS